MDSAMRRSIGGWTLTVAGVISCPCHLMITVPLAVALLGGTALGGWIATHEGAIALGAGVYFVGALALGMLLLSAQRPQAPHPSDVRAGQPEREGARCPPGHSLRVAPTMPVPQGRPPERQRPGAGRVPTPTQRVRQRSETGAA